MNGQETTAGVLVSEKVEEKKGEGILSLGNLFMLPAALIGLVIGAFPLSLPVLYLIALLFV